MTDIALLLLITGAVVVAGYFIFRFLINFTRKPILEINLSPIDNPKRSEKQKITDLVDSFVRNGFEPAGDYECWEIPSLIISGFVRPSEQMTGVIYDHPISGIWADVYVQYTDGRSLTVSNAPTGHDLSHMPQQTKFYCRESSLDDLLKKALAERKKEGRITITKEAFASNFEAQYQKEMKWRIDRGGPTSVEVMRVANTMGESLDSERLLNTTHQLQTTWMKEKNKPRKIRSGLFEAVLPEEFQPPEVFRQRMEQKSAPIPLLKMPALPVYIALVSGMALWCYYGYQYNQTHFPVSFTELIVFLAGVLILVIIMVSFREYRRRVRMCPVLKRMADLRPGAFLIITGASPSLFYARERWIGKVSFKEGSELENAFTRLDAITKHSMGSLVISRKSWLNKVIGGSDKDNILLPKSDFSRKFELSGTDTAFAGKLLNVAISDTIKRLEEIGRPLVEVSRNSVGVEIAGDLSTPRKEAVLRQFLQEAETIIEAAVQQAN